MVSYFDRFFETKGAIFEGSKMDLNELREEYLSATLDSDTAHPDPFKQFESWFQAASKMEILEPNAMVLATADTSGHPSARSVLLKYFDKDGFVFFTNYNSRKAQQIANNPNVTALFPWYSLQRQIEISGTVTKISAAKSMKYFALRPRGSQLGAWVSMQSSVVSTRSLLQSKLKDLEKKFSGGEVPMPDFWGGFCIKPTRFEFWQGGAKRIHDRLEYKIDESGSWTTSRLSP